MPIRINVNVETKGPIKDPLGAATLTQKRQIEVPDEFGFLNNIKLNQVQFSSAIRTPLQNRGYGLVGVKVMGNLSNPDDVQAASSDYQVYLKKIGGNVRERMMLHYGQRTGPTKENWTGIINPSEQSNRDVAEQTRSGNASLYGAMEAIATVPAYFKAFTGVYNAGVAGITRLTNPTVGKGADILGKVGLGGAWVNEARHGGGPLTIWNWATGKRPAPAPGMEGANAFDIVAEATMMADLSKPAAKLATEGAKSVGRASKVAGEFAQDQMAKIMEAFGAKQRPTDINPRDMLRDMRGLGIDFGFSGDPNEARLVALMKSITQSYSKDGVNEVRELVNKARVAMIAAERGLIGKDEAANQVTEFMNRALSLRRANSPIADRIIGGEFKVNGAQPNAPESPLPDLNKIGENEPDINEKLKQTLKDRFGDSWKEEWARTKQEGEEKLQQFLKEKADRGEGLGRPPFAEPEVDKKLQDLFKEAEQKQINDAIEEGKRQEREASKAKEDLDPKNKKDMTKEELKDLKEEIKKAEAAEKKKIDETVKKWKAEAKERKLEEADRKKREKQIEDDGKKIDEGNKKKDDKEKEDEINKVNEAKKAAGDFFDFPFEPPTLSPVRGGSLPIAPAFYKSSFNIPAYIIGSGRLEYADN